MHPEAITAFLLLMGFSMTTSDCICEEDHPCGGGWSRIDDNRCATFIQSMKTFDEAQEHCRTLNSDLVSIHEDKVLLNVLCLTWRINHVRHTIWIGARKSEGEFKWTDGSPFSYYLWEFGEPDNINGEEDCVESNYSLFGLWNDAECSKKNFFVCAKKM